MAKMLEQSHKFSDITEQKLHDFSVTTITVRSFAPAIT